MIPLTRCVLIAAAAALSARGQSAGSNIVAGAGYALPTPLHLAPGQVVTIFAAGVGSTLTQPVFAGPGKLPISLAGISVTIRQGTDMPASILEVNPVASCGTGCGVMTAITIQVPYGLATFFCPPGNVCPAPSLVILTELLVAENGLAGSLTTVTPLPDQVHILTACDTVLPTGAGILPVGGLPCQAMVAHANGILVSSTKPATVGEELVAYAVGLGATNPAVPTGQPATQPIPAVGLFTLDFNFHPDALPAKPSLITLSSFLLPALPIPLFTGLAPGYPGLYQINFIVPPLPSGTLPCASGSVLPPLGGLVNTNLTVSIGGAASFDGAGICVALAK